MGRYEILEHTADIGLRAEGTSLADVFEAATRGLADIEGLWRPGKGEAVRIEVATDDLGSLLVDWLSEVLYLQDARRAAIAGIDVEVIEGWRAAGTVSFLPLGDVPSEGVQIKAVTYHQLSVEQMEGGWCAVVFFDI